MWSSLACLLGCLGTLCGCGGCCDCDVCTVCVACVYAGRVQGCDGDRNAGVRAEGAVVAVTGGVSIWMVHLVQVCVYCRRHAKYKCGA